MLDVVGAPDTVTQDVSQDLSERLSQGEPEGLSRGLLKDDTEELPAGLLKEEIDGLSERELKDDAESLSERLIKHETEGLSHALLKDDSQEISQSFEQEPPQKLPAPREDDQDEDVDSGVPSATPYDWGVKPVARPRGAWLLDTPDESAQAPAPAKPVSEPKAPVASESPSPGGPRAFLIRKASDEVRRFQPVLEALERQNLIEPDQLDPNPAAPAAGRDDDDAVSLDSFRDSRPSHDEVEQELSPMRLFEEIRRLRRLTQALVDKGVIPPSESENSESD